MNINLLSDEKLAKELAKILFDFRGDSFWIQTAKFLRQCVKDSMPIEDQIYAMLDELEKNQAFTFDMIPSDKDELVGEIRKLMEPK